ncbi:MAG: hypothetical protein NT155_04530 [Candidatus Staskawiczbacteria bacterium]|nr:hypothetical protein [Candidatus Staskawiczbacteria bacterium]
MNFKPKRFKVFITIMAPSLFWLAGFLIAFLNNFSLLYSKPATVYMIGKFPFKPSCSYLIGGLWSPDCSMRGFVHSMFLEFPIFCIFLMILIYIIWSLVENNRTKIKS